jgi:transcriptional regulator with XRE-family HTH domain
MSFTPAQCRAARALIGWSQDQLANASRVAKATIANFETGDRAPYERTLADIRRALESAGVEFTNGGQPGVRLKAAGQEPPDVPADFAPGGTQTYFPAQPRRNTKVPR